MPTRLHEVYTMGWSRQQQDAMGKVRSWIRNPSGEQTFRLFGWAGTGKTTMAKELAQMAGTVLFGAYTGKAASVLRSKGCEFAQTIHQMIYNPSSKSKLKLKQMQESLMEMVHEILSEDPEADVKKFPYVVKLMEAIKVEEENLKRPSFQLNTDSAVRSADLVIIDECSMVDQRMGMDLLSFDTPVLVLGDPAQLPPVKGGGFFTDRRQEPDVMLTEIHRQARGNPIIDLATKIRLGETLQPGTYGTSQVITGKPSEEMVTSADQILVGANKTRRKCNHRMRSLLGRGESLLPVSGDRLVCLRNDHEVGLLNGTIWEATEVDSVEGYDRMHLGVKSEEDGLRLDVEAHVHYFEGREDELSHWNVREAQSFDYGYALTTHKAQGSQWPNVFVFDESWVFKGQSKRWLYTAVTRASEKVTICRN